MPQVDINIRANADTTAFAQVEASLNRLGTRLTSVGQSLVTGFGVSVMQRTFGVVESAMRGAIDGAFELATEIHRGSQALGVSTDAYQVLGKVMREAGGDADMLGKAVTKGNLSLFAARNESSSAAAAYRRLGLSVGELESLPVEARFEAIGRAVSNSKDQTGAMSAASEILGTRNLPIVLAALQRLAKDGYGNLDEAMTKAGTLMQKETIDRLHDAELAIAKFKKTVTIQTGETIGAGFLIGESFMAHKAETLAAIFKAAFFGSLGIANLGGELGALNASKTKEAPPAKDNTGAAMVELSERQKKATDDLADATLDLQRLEADPNQSAFDKKDRILALLKTELAARSALLAIEKEIVKTDPEAKGDPEKKVTKLEAQNAQLRDKIRFLEGGVISARHAKDSAGNAKWQEMNEPGGGLDDFGAGKNNLGTLSRSAGAGAQDWIVSLGGQAEQVSKAIENTIGSAVSGISAGIEGWINGTKTFAQSLASIGGSILKTMLNTVVQMGAQWLVNQALVKAGIISINALQDSQRVANVAKENAATAATLPLKTASAAASGISSFGLALVFGALAVGLILALAGGFASGGFTSPGDRNQVAGVVHAGEWVAPKWMVEHPRFGEIIGGLEGARQGSPGFAVGGFASGAISSITRPAYVQPAASAAANHHIYLDRAEWARAMQEDSAGFFHEIAAREIRRNA